MVKKFKAFTIVELVVVMIVSIITFSAIYTVYSLVKRHFFSSTKKNESINVFLQCEKIMTSDFRKARRIENDGFSGSIKCFSDSDSIIYDFADSAIYRVHKEAIDSFILFPHSVKISFVENTNLVNDIFLKVIPRKDTVFIEIKKDYDANSLLDLN